MDTPAAGHDEPAARQLPADLVPLAELPGFDPGAHAVQRPEEDLRPVPAQSLHPDAIRARFRSPPSWRPEPWPVYRFSGRQPIAAAVLVPLVLHEQPSVLLTQRTLHLPSHSGQLAFPGGKQEPGDRDLVATALREASEEIGVLAADVEIAAQLPGITTGTGYLVTPVVGLLRPGTPMRPCDGEVAELFELPLADVLDPRNQCRHELRSHGTLREWMSVTCEADGRRRFIWGATAAVLRDLFLFFRA